MFNKEANNNSGLCPFKGQYYVLYIHTKTPDHFPILSVGTDKT
jgi:hypothetical protein